MYMILTVFSSFLGGLGVPTVPPSTRLDLTIEYSFLTTAISDYNRFLSSPIRSSSFHPLRSTVNSSRLGIILCRASISSTMALWKMSTLARSNCSVRLYPPVRARNSSLAGWPFICSRLISMLSNTNFLTNSQHRFVSPSPSLSISLKTALPSLPVLFLSTASVNSSTLWVVVLRNSSASLSVTLSPLISRRKEANFSPSRHSIMKSWKLSFILLKSRPSLNFQPATCMLNSSQLGSCPKADMMSSMAARSLISALTRAEVWIEAERTCSTPLSTISTSCRMLLPTSKPPKSTLTVQRLPKLLTHSRRYSRKLDCSSFWCFSKQPCPLQRRSRSVVSPALSTTSSFARSVPTVFPLKNCVLFWQALCMWISLCWRRTILSASCLDLKLDMLAVSSLSSRASWMLRICLRLVGIWLRKLLFLAPICSEAICLILLARWGFSDISASDSRLLSERRSLAELRLFFWRQRVVWSQVRWLFLRSIGFISLFKRRI